MGSVMRFALLLLLIVTSACNAGELAGMAFADYGPTILGWLFTVVLLPLLARAVNSWTKNQMVRGVLERLGVAVRAAVLEIGQTYADDAKKGQADGKWTAEEQKRARDMAIEAARDYLGPKGIRELVKVLGIDPSFVDRLLGKHVEAEVKALKVATTGKTPASA